MSAERLTVGTKYEAKMSDCCISGTFTATVVKVNADDENDEFPGYEFDNGVAFSNVAGVTFTEVTT